MAAGTGTRTLYRIFRTYYPFTVSGTILFILALRFLWRGFTLKSPYELLLALIALPGLFGLAVLVRLIAYRFSVTADMVWEEITPLFARSDDFSHAISGMTPKTPYFFRLHFSIYGTLKIGNEQVCRVFQEISCTGGETVPFAVYVPLCGIMRVRGTFKICDAFGLTRAGFGIPIERDIPVLPAPLKSGLSQRISTSTSDEEEQSRQSTDEERYYMREYVPGDRSRDINWKSSSRISVLMTRISPYTKKRIKLLEICFRPLRRGKNLSLDAHIHLDAAKSWLVAFIRKVKQDDPDFRFHVYAPLRTWQIETESEIDRFAEDVCSMPFSNDEQGIYPATVNAKELFVFSTPFDESLMRFLHERQNRQTHVFMTSMEHGVGQSFPHAVLAEEEFRLFRNTGIPVIPLKGMLSREKVPVRRPIVLSGTVTVLPIRVKVI